MTREKLGWGSGRGLVFRNHTHLAKVYGLCPVERRKARRHKQCKAALEVWVRDGFTCRKCGHNAVEFRELSERGLITHIREGELTVDHVIPASCGGSDEMFNLTTLCRACNTRRGAYLPDPVTLL